MDILFICNLLMCPQSSAHVLSIFSTIVMAGGEFQLCWGLQLLDQVFQPIKKDTPEGKPIGSDGDLIPGPILICLGPWVEGVCKCKESCKTHQKVPQGLSFLKAKLIFAIFVGTRLPVYLRSDVQRHPCPQLLP